MKILVCGGRTFSDVEFLYNRLDDIFSAQDPEDITIIDGKAKGADSLAYDWAVDRGCKTERYPADWTKYGKSAGHIRNKQMLDEGAPDLVVAFPGGSGTADMVKRARQRGIEVLEIE